MKYIIYLLLFSVIIKLFISMNQEQKYYPSKGEQLVNATLTNTARILKEKYDLIPCGEGAAMPGGPIQKLILCFDTKYPHSQKQLRQLLIQSAHELLNQINENNEIQEFLNERPFTIRNIEIIIYNHDRNGRSTYYPEISNVQIHKTKLIYSSINPIDTFKYKNEYYERYEDAINAIQEGEE